MAKKTAKDEELNKKVRDWWNQNPFTLGVATGDYASNDLVGGIPFEKMDLHYFEELERKFRKHSGTGAQEDGMPILSKLVDYKDIIGKKVLDVASGTGIHLTSFVREGASVTGINLTPFAVAQARRNLELRNLKAEILEMDAQEMSFPDNTFDFVNAWGCLMHMPSTESAIEEIYRVLKPSGKMIAYMYNKSSWPFWFNIFFLRGVLLLGLIRFKGDIIRLTSRYSDGSHRGGNMLTKFYTPKEAEDMFKDAGFSKAEAYPWDIGYEPDHWPMVSFPIFKYLPKTIKAWMSKRWGYGLIVRAQK